MSRDCRDILCAVQRLAGHRDWKPVSRASLRTLQLRYTAPPTATNTPNVKMSVPITLTCGGTPSRVAPKTHNGKVCVFPATKLVMT